MDYQQTCIQKQKHLTNIYFYQNLRQLYIMAPITTVRGPSIESTFVPSILTFCIFFSCKVVLQFWIQGLRIELHKTLKGTFDRMSFHRRILVSPDPFIRNNNIAPSADISTKCQHCKARLWAPPISKQTRLYNLRRWLCLKFWI